MELNHLDGKRNLSKLKLLMIVLHTVVLEL